MATMFSSRIYLLFTVIISLSDVLVQGCGDFCEDNPVFTPSRLVVKHGDPASATCVVCEKACLSNTFDLEIPVGVRKRNGTTLTWTVDKMNEWDTPAMCFYNTDTEKQCCTSLPVIVYQLPENVSISVMNHTGPMLEHRAYTLQCTVHNVAPIEKLNVDFFRDQTILVSLSLLLDKKAQKTPATKTFTHSIDTSKEHDGAQYRCEARLDLGAEGPQPPPVTSSELLSATVYYGPYLKGSANPEPITITEGNTLNLSCLAEGNPHPSYTWTLPSKSPSSYNGSVLTVPSVGFEHGGLYICDVRTNMRNVTVKFSVEVRVNLMPYIIAGTIIAVALVSFAFVMGYIRYYKNNRMGQYNLKDVFRFRPLHIPVPTQD